MMLSTFFARYVFFFNIYSGNKDHQYCEIAHNF